MKSSGTLLVVGSSLSDGRFGVISLGKKLTHISLSRLRSINKYLGVAKPLAVSYASEVQVGLRVPTPQLALQGCSCEHLARLQESVSAGPEIPA